MDGLAETVIAELEGFCAKHNLSASYVGYKAINESRVMEKLNKGRITLRVVEKLRRYMREFEDTQPIRRPDDESG